VLLTFQQCTVCLIRDRTSPDNFRFRCPKCKSSQSIRKGSFFEQSRLSIPQTLYLTCCWACKIPVKNAAFVSDVCDRSVTQWFQLVAKRKYNMGHLVQQQWVWVIRHNDKTRSYPAGGQQKGRDPNPDNTEICLTRDHDLLGPVASVPCSADFGICSPDGESHRKLCRS